MAGSLDQTVGVVITRRVHGQRAAEFEAGLREVIRAESQQPDWISAEVLRRPLTGTHREYNSVYRFSDEERSCAWEMSQSPARRSWSPFS